MNPEEKRTQGYDAQCKNRFSLRLNYSFKYSEHFAVLGQTIKQIWLWLKRSLGVLLVIWLGRIKIESCHLARMKQIPLI